MQKNFYLLLWEGKLHSVFYIFTIRRLKISNSNSNIFLIHLASDNSCFLLQQPSPFLNWQQISLPAPALVGLVLTTGSLVTYELLPVKVSRIILKPVVFKVKIFITISFRAPVQFNIKALVCIETSVTKYCPVCDVCADLK